MSAAAGEPLDAAAILAARRDPTPLRLEVHAALPSTNAHAAARVAALDPGEVLAVLADHQTEGRGRRGRVWHCGPGGGIALSVARRVQCAHPLGALAIACGLAAHEALEALGVRGLRVKWPNDLVHPTAGGELYAKLGGLLVELSGGRHGRHEVVVGVGLNVRLDAATRAGLAGPAVDYAVTDLAALGAGDLGRNRIAAALIDAVSAALARYEGAGFAPFHRRWGAADAFAGATVRVEHAQGPSVGRALGIDADGALLVEVPGQGRLRIVSGETRAVRMAS